MRGTTEEKMKEYSELEIGELKERVMKTALVMALVFLERGHTRNADEAMRVYQKTLKVKVE